MPIQPGRLQHLNHVLVNLHNTINTLCKYKQRHCLLLCSTLGYAHINPVSLRFRVEGLGENLNPKPTKFCPVERQTRQQQCRTCTAGSGTPTPSIHAATTHFRTHYQKPTSSMQTHALLLPGSCTHCFQAWQLLLLLVLLQGCLCRRQHAQRSALCTHTFCNEAVGIAELPEGLHELRHHCRACNMRRALERSLKQFAATVAGCQKPDQAAVSAHKQQQVQQSVQRS